MIRVVSVPTPCAGESIAVDPRCWVPRVAGTTRLRGPGRSHQHELESVGQAFIGQLPTPLCRNIVENGTVETSLLRTCTPTGLSMRTPGTARHLLHAKILDGDQAVALGQVGSELVREIGSTSSLPRFQLCDGAECASQSVAVLASPMLPSSLPGFVVLAVVPALPACAAHLGSVSGA